jgi:hypothetical protein
VASSAELLPGRFSSALELSSSRLPERAKGNVLFRSVGSGLDLQGSDAMHGIRGGCAANPKCVVHGVDEWIKGIGEMKCHIRPGTFRSRRVNKTQIPGCKSPRTAGSALEPISFERGGRWDVWGDVWG